MDVDADSVFKQVQNESDGDDKTNLQEIVSVFSALDKHDKILIFSGLVDGCDLSEIVDDIGSSKSTAYNYVKELRSADLVEKKTHGSGFDVTRKGCLVNEFLSQLDSDLNYLRLEDSMVKLSRSVDDADMDVGIGYGEESFMNRIEDKEEKDDGDSDDRPVENFDYSIDGMGGLGGK